MAIVANTNLTPWKLRPLSAQEAALNAGFNYMSVITANDLTVTTNDLLQTLTLANWKSGDIVYRVAWRLKTPFKDASDATFVASPMSVGSNAGVAFWIAAIEVNENGTEILSGMSTTAATLYTAAGTLTVTFDPAATWALNNLDIGEVEIFVEAVRTPTLTAAQMSTPMTK